MSNSEERGELLARLAATVGDKMRTFIEQMAVLTNDISNTSKNNEDFYKAIERHRKLMPAFNSSVAKLEAAFVQAQMPLKFWESWPDNENLKCVYVSMPDKSVHTNYYDAVREASKAEKGAICSPAHVSTISAKSRDGTQELVGVYTLNSPANILHVLAVLNSNLKQRDNDVS